MPADALTRAGACGEGIGASLPRKEDARLLTGLGRFVADRPAHAGCWARFVRSPHAHARVLGIDASRALGMPGVVAVLTGADMAADGVGPMTSLWRLACTDARPMAEPPRHALARGAVRHVGEAVAVVIARSRAAAADAAEAVSVEYAPLPAAADAHAALLEGAPRLHPEAPDNVCLRACRGDAAAVDAALRAAACVVRARVVHQRVAGAALEPRALEASWDGASRHLTLYATTQVPHHVRRQVAAELGMDELRIRVVAPDVGGGFGYKGKHYPEETVLCWAARRLGGTVRWVATRSESFLTDLQGRDHDTRAELALDADGRFLALRVQTLANIGAYVSNFGAAIPGAIYASLLAGPYRTPAISVAVTCVFTHTVPTDAYRGAGRPEACSVLESLCDRAAAALGVDRAEIRRRNLIPAAAMPYRTPLGATYDCADFPRVLERALAASDYVGFEARRAESAARGLARGIGIAVFVESSGVGPTRLSGPMGARTGYFESAEVRLDASGGVTALLGTHNHGQGHETTYAQILASRLGVPTGRIEVIEGDTAVVPYGTGTFGSRSIAVGGAALALAADRVIAKARLIAAHLLEAAPEDIAHEAGHFRVAGTDRTVDLAEVARAANMGWPLPAGLEPGLQALAAFDPPDFAYTNGCHVAEVEIDADTGALRLVRYTAVDDFGVIVNPMIVHGQVHGGIAQGAGQALLEQVVFDGDGAQALCGSFLDYALPRADDLPGFDTLTDESQPFVHNPLGAKGCGESGAIGSPAAIVSAARDALSALGIAEIDMPLTPQRLWRAIVRARVGP